MSIEPRPDRKHHRTVTRLRQMVGLVVSVAVHAGLAALLLLFVASSDPGVGKRNAVPISVVPRGGDGAGVPAVAPGPLVVESNTPATPGAHRPGHTTKRVDLSIGAGPDLTQAAVTALAQAGETAGPSQSPPGGTDGNASTGDGGTAVSGIEVSTDEAGTGGGAGTGDSQSGQAGRAPALDAAARAEADRAYALVVRKALERQGAYPSTARRLGLEGLVEMLVSIDGSGALVQRRVTTSSGFPQLDEAALASADRLGPLPPPPGGRPMDIRIPVRFSVRQN